MEPAVKKYLVKVMYSFIAGFAWLFINAIAGIYYQLGITHGSISVINLLFYGWLLGSLAVLIWYYYKTWNKPSFPAE